MSAPAVPVSCQRSLLKKTSSTVVAVAVTTIHQVSQVIRLHHQQQQEKSNVSAVNLYVFIQQKGLY